MKKQKRKIKPADISYERFRHVYSSFGIVKENAKEVSSYGSPSVSANALPIKSEDSIFDMDGLKRSEAPKERITNEKNDDKAKENNCTYVSVDDKRSGHVESLEFIHNKNIKFRIYS